MGVDVAGQTGLQGLLTRCAMVAPTSTALITANGEYTFSELAGAAQRVSTRLNPGTRVVIRLRNDAASVVAVHAAWAAGCSVVAASTMVPESEVRRRLSATCAATLLVPAAEGLEVAVEPAGGRCPAPDDEALVMFTSGTTGVPKGASLTFAALRGSVAGLADGTAVPPAGRAPRVPARAPQLVFVPIAHMGGFLGMLAAWWMGKPLLLREKFSVSTLCEVTSRYRLGVLKLTPAMVWDLVQADGAELPGVTSVVVGTAALAEATRVAFEAKYGVPILRNYGQTEFAGAIAFERPQDVAAGIRPPNTVGRIAPGVEVVILDPDGNVLPNGEIGEIAARAVSAMSGYIGHDGRLADPDEWLRTGDLGRLDDQGFLYVVGRVRDVVVCGGFNVYPAQVEAALNDLPRVADSAVAGVPDERLGEIPVAAVVMHPGACAGADEIRDALRDRLAAYELPRKIAVVAEIPRLDTGKVDRAGVARLFDATRA
ncbi:class I adenylate-forming enzyme family protein [uncultured Mycobacterium sp.]|uniref:class I adenylate-forming enzyme family protein n=1 Tax=uncultured Mycobacterium sp. TaxID=171292 RepID=UPI0035C97268